jgi:signal transduction histidine kinase/CheY-like chemotaxis protein
MPTRLRALLLADSDSKAETLVRQVRQGDCELAWERVESTAALEQALVRGPWDIMVADDALRQSEERYRLVSSLVLDLAYSFRVAENETLIRDWATDGFDRLGGEQVCAVATADRLFGNVHPDDAAAVREAIRRALAGQARESVECRVLTAGKDERAIRWWYHRFMGVRAGKHSQVQYLVGAGRDITERKVIDEQSRQAQKIEAVGRLAGGVAHDFNNLLQSMLGYADLLLVATPEADDRHQDIVAVRDCARKASFLTAQLLAFSRRQVIAPQLTDLNAVLTGAERMLSGVLREDISLHTALLADLPQVRIDPPAIEQAVLNLVVNARDAMPHGGRITISTAVVTLGRDESRCVPESRVGRFVCLSVTDTGCGMPTATIRHLFEPFFTTKPKGQGSGLGLAMVYGLMKQHDGWVNVYSEVGRGTTFKLYFPAHVPRDVQETPDEATATVPGVGQGQHILVVEDELALRDLAARLLRRGGYRVTTAGTGTEAIAAARAHPVDLVFSDVVLPDVSGLDLVAQLTPAAGTRFLFTSGYTDERSRWPWIRERGFPFIHKPYLMDDLLAAVQKTFAKPLYRP